MRFLEQTYKDASLAYIHFETFKCLQNDYKQINAHNCVHTYALVHPCQAYNYIETKIRFKYNQSKIKLKC